MATDVEKVRSLYGDVAPDVDGEYIIPESVVQGFIDIANGDLIYAASLACGAIASSELYLQKVLRTDDLTINGAATAAEWRLRAKDLFEQSQALLLSDREIEFAFFPEKDVFDVFGEGYM